ncbi:MAG: sugar transferase [Bacillota bacterium]|nr:sugar transferase [Bacillota bacterium]
MYRKNVNRWLKHWDFIVLDLIVLQMAYIFSCIVRNGWIVPFKSKIYITMGLIICFGNICALYFQEPHHGIMNRGYFLEFRSVVYQVTMIVIIEACYLFLSKNGSEFSRVSFIVFYISGIFLMYIERVLWKKYLLHHNKDFAKKRKIIAVLTSKSAPNLIKAAFDTPYKGWEIVGIVLADRDDMVGQDIQGIPIVCTADKIPDYIQTKWIDSIWIHVKKKYQLPIELINTCIEMGVTVHNTLINISAYLGTKDVRKIGDYHILTASLNMATPLQLLLKRLMDICGAVIGLIFTGIATLFLAPAIYIASPGPIFFSQMRIGENGRMFKIYKFRSMYMDAEERKKELMEKNEIQGLMFKMDADPRIIGSGTDGTRKGVGWFIRRTSLDEFPQFWNVLKGEMSLVGTRPPTVEEWNQYDYHHRARMAIKPGITGMWQVSGRSDITDFEEVVRLDREYIEKWNLGLDIKILFKTLFVVIKGSGSK